MHKFLNQRPVPGLVDLLRGDAALEEVIYHDPESGINAIFSGVVDHHASPAPDFHGLRDLLESLACTYDMVILDAPPVLVADEVLQYAQIVENVVVVVQWGRTKQELVIETLNQLATAGANVGGIVLSQVNAKRYKHYAAVDFHYGYPDTARATA